MTAFHTDPPAFITAPTISGSAWPTIFSEISLRIVLVQRGDNNVVLPRGQAKGSRPAKGSEGFFHHFTQCLNLEIIVIPYIIYMPDQIGRFFLTNSPLP